MRRMLALLLVSAGVGAVALGSGRAGTPGPSAVDPGQALFTAKQCGRCHVPRSEHGAGPALEELRRPQGEMQLAGRLWNHVPAMVGLLERKRLQWPAITPVEMAQLMAYLGAERARDPKPDVQKGRTTLMRKGCLKCHRLRGEGGTVDPDLAAPRADYASPSAWAAAMWAHTPAMAAMATARGVPYPRFAGDEMGDLVGFLRQAATVAAEDP
jgi:cytochrome c551/c552